MAASPRYGLTVTASAAERVEEGLGLAGGRRADVARLASMMTGTSAGIGARSRSRTAIPGVPQRLVEGKVA